MRSRIAAEKQNNYSNVEKILENQAAEISLQGRQLADLVKGFDEIVKVLQQQHQSNPKLAIDQINENLLALGKVTVSIHRKMQENENNTEVAAIRTGQQKIQEVIKTTGKDINNSLSIYFSWKRIIIIVGLTVIASSCCSLAIAKIFWSNQSNNTESIQPAVKKPSKLKNK
jgi:DNA-binding ferritin-like protein